MIRPIDIARELNISTSALRHYEAWNMIPIVERTQNGYRIYTKEHIAYFECIRGMSLGFSMDVIKEILNHIKARNVIPAIILINKIQHDFYEERVIAENMIALLDTPRYELLGIEKDNKLLTINEVSKITNVPTTAIRHWERAGLISPLRNADNGYRLFSASHIRQIVFIRSLKKTVYFLDTIRTIIKDLENKDYDVVKKAMQESLIHFDELGKQQLKGIHAIYKLCNQLGLLE